MSVCGICGQALPSEAAARRHVNRAHPARPPRCPRCSAAAAGYEELRQHVEAAHPEPQPLPRARSPELECPFCGEAAGRQLEAHVRARHERLLGAGGWFPYGVASLV